VASEEEDTNKGKTLAVRVPNMGSLFLSAEGDSRIAILVGVVVELKERRNAAAEWKERGDFEGRDVTGSANHNDATNSAGWKPTRRDLLLLRQIRINLHEGQVSRSER
jgi:hypothetical protein